MISLGVSFISFAAVLLGIGFQSHFDWKIPNLGIVLWILCGLFFVSGLALTIIGITRSWGDITPRQKKHNRKLKAHFQNMKEVSLNIIPNLAEPYGEISITDRGKALHRFPDEFVAHFPKEANTWDTYCQAIDVHNRKYMEFRLSIRKAFESHGLEIMPVGQTYTSPYIYEAIYHPFYVWCRDRLRKSEHPQVDFTRIEIDPSRGTSNLFVSGWNSEAIACAEKEIDKEKCKAAILDVVNKYEQEDINLISSAARILKLVHGLQTKLTTTISNIDKYWPDTKDYRFRKSEQCPICRNIFG
jgi:hypothetical protein